MEISVTDSEEVLVARIASRRHDPVEAPEDVLLDRQLLDDGLDDQVAVAWQSSMSVVNVIRPTSSAASSSLSLPRLTARAVECSTCWRPRSSVSSFISTPTTS